MPKIEKDPENLRPYLFHGINLQWGDRDTEAIGNCPFCAREKKFSVNIESGLWRCFVCAEGSDKGGGNAHTFIRKLWEMSDEDESKYSILASDRGFLNPDTLATWGVCRSQITREWMIPGYGINRHLNQLYKYVQLGDKKRLLLTPTLGHQLFGLNGTFDPTRPTIYICEGPWDAIAFWEVLSQTKIVANRFVATSNFSASLAASANVIGIPGCETFFDHWLPLFSGKEVVFLLDNDHERKHPKTGQMIPAAAYLATQKHIHKLSSYDKPPSSIKFLRWSGEAGKAFDPEQPSGYDLRDHFISSGDALGDRITALEEILGLCTPPPKEWLGEAPRGRKTQGKGGVGTVKCEKYSELIQTCRKAMRWIEGLDYALSVMLASIVSTMQLGDQLWIKVISPASSGKSSLCEAISTAKDYVYALSTMRGFYSGYRDGESGGEDFSLITKIKGKTLVTKDGDNILQLPNRNEVLAQARDVYDTVSRTSFKNAASNSYEGVRMTWILCGTSALRALDTSELGARFLACVIMEGIDDDLEDEILWRVANRANREMAYKSDGEAKTHQSPEMTDMMQATGGYINYLRENATELLSAMEMDEEHLRLCTRLGKFVAFMRARPSHKQDENAEREFGARLVSQLTRLARGLAVVLNSDHVCEEAMKRTRRVAMDTSRGVTLEIVRHLFHAGDKGMTLGGLANATNRTDDRTKTLLRFLRRIDVVSLHQASENGVKKQARWKLTKKLAKLYHEVTGEIQEEVLEDA